MTQSLVALDDVTFSVPEGSMVGFLGANGAGKTTSLKIIMDFIRADKGSVIFSKALGNERMEVFRNLGFLPERPYFYPNLTGHEFLKYMGTLSELTELQIQRGIKKWAERFGIDHALQRPLRTYSKGMLQRIGFLATILHSPKFILLDEPLSGLDPIGRKELKDVIIEVHKEGKTVFFSSHIVSDIEEICDRVVFLQNGKLVYDGSVPELLKSNSGSEFLIKVDRLPPNQVETPLKQIVSLPGEVDVITVHESHKQRLLLELVSKSINILGVEVVKPSLEEIFYHIKAR
jgi:ABC-2 type transport system ATP-binding protein